MPGVPGVFYRDAFDTNLPGAFWLHSLLRSAFGERTEVIRLFDLAVFGWDRDASHPCPGGVLFSQNPRYSDRNTVSNAPG